MHEGAMSMVGLNAQKEPARKPRRLQGLDAFMNEMAGMPVLQGERDIVAGIQLENRSLDSVTETLQSAITFLRAVPHARHSVASYTEEDIRSLIDYGVMVTEFAQVRVAWLTV